AAVACMEKHDIGLAILDVLMPGISGDAVAERLRQIDPSLRVVLMTGSDEPFGAASGLPVLRKPFPQDERIAAVRRFARSGRLGAAELALVAVGAVRDRLGRVLVVQDLDPPALGIDEPGAPALDAPERGRDDGEGDCLRLGHRGHCRVSTLEWVEVQPLWKL